MSRLAQNTLISAAETITLIILAIIATPMILHGLGNTGYGIFVFLSMFSMTGVLSFFDLGMEGAVMSSVARAEASGQHGRSRRLLQTAVLFYGCIGLLLGMALVGLLQLITTWMHVDTSAVPGLQLQVAVLCTGLNVALQFLTVPYVAFIQGQQRFIGIKSATMALNITQYAGIMLLAAFSPRLDLIGAFIMAVSVMRFLAAWWLSRKVESMELIAVSMRECWRELRTTSGWLLGNRIVGLVYNQTHKGLISLGLSIANLGLFDIIARPASFFRVLLGIVYSAVIPRSAALSVQQHKAGLTQLFAGLSCSAALLLLPIGVWLIGQAGPILTVWVGAEYAKFALALQLLIAAGMLNVVTSIVSTMAVGMEIVPRTLRIAVVVTSVNLVASIVLLPWIGLTGASVALCLAEGVGLPLTLALVSRELPGGGVALWQGTSRLLALSLPVLGAQLILADRLSSQPLWSVLSGIVLGAIQMALSFAFLPRSHRLTLLDASRQLLARLLPVRSVTP